MKPALKVTPNFPEDQSAGRFHGRLNNLAHQRRALTGILLLIIATILFAAQDAMTKRLTTQLPVSQILFVRYFTFSLFALIFASSRIGLRVAMRSAVPHLQIVRCLLMCCEIALFTFALRYLGIAEIHAIFACFPLIVTALSVPLLGESVGWRRWVAVLCGFLGTLILLRPGSGVFDSVALLPLSCALIYAIYNLLTRRVSRYDRFETSLLYFGLVGLVACSAFALFQWQPIGATTAWFLLAVSITSVLAHLLLIKSLELTAAVVLQPFNYFILVWAILIGYLFYAETLATIELVGAGIVVASGVFIGYREYKLAVQP